MIGARAAGKKSKVVIVAVMRKLVTTLNAMLRDDVPWADRLIDRHSVHIAKPAAHRADRVKAVAARKWGREAPALTRPN
jgi:hypothetical protein